MVSRRRALERLAGVAGAVGLAGCSVRRGDDGGPAGLPPNPHADRLPRRQFAQRASLPKDAAGNDVQPRFRRVLLLELAAEPTADTARVVERAMRSLEATFEWRPRGLFHVLAWGTGYFERVGRLGRAPVSPPQVLSRTDDPDLLAPDAALVLASDVPSHLARAETAMFESGSFDGAAPAARLGDVFERTQRRTGFLGEGLPADHRDAEGVPAAVPDDAPMFTGFFSDRRGTQASEDRVAIERDAFADGTTMHLSHLTEDLEEWYALTESERVARMFSPAFSPAEIAEFDADVPFADAVREHAREFDVVGHHEKVAQVREGGEPRLLRRDFNTLDGGTPGVHFVSFQRELADFRRTRKAMNGWYVRDDSEQITDRTNNGILNFVTVQSRANCYVPPRDERALPLTRL